MTTSPKPVSFGRRLFRWLLISVGICLAPIMVLAVVVVGALTLDRDGAVLRENVAAATGAEWSPKVQLSLGSTVFSSAAAGLYLVPEAEAAEARAALRAVKRASVGVYEREGTAAVWSREELFRKTDNAMAKRGWTRMVGVASDDETVLIYAPTDVGDSGEIEICLAVVSRRELVVVSTRVDANSFSQLVETHAGKNGRGGLKLAALKL